VTRPSIIFSRQSDSTYDPIPCLSVGEAPPVCTLAQRHDPELSTFGTTVKNARPPFPSSTPQPGYFLCLTSWPRELPLPLHPPFSRSATPPLSPTHPVRYKSPSGFCASLSPFILLPPDALVLSLRPGLMTTLLLFAHLTSEMRILRPLHL